MLYALRIFCDLATTGSFTEAAARNHITQSAVSHQIRALEEKFGCRLVNRNRPAGKLTEAGLKVLCGSMDLIGRYEKLEGLFKESSDEVSGHIRIVTTIAIGLHELPNYTAIFKKKYPKTDVSLVYVRSPNIYQQLLNYQADLGFLSFPTKHPLLKFQLLKNDRLVIIASPEYASVTSGRAGLHDLFKNPLLTLEKGLCLRTGIDRAMNGANIRPNILHSFDNIESVKQAVELGMGIAIVPEATIRNEIALKKLKKIVLKGERWNCPLNVVTRKNAEPSPAVQAFLQFLFAHKN